MGEKRDSELILGGFLTKKVSFLLFLVSGKHKESSTVFNRAEHYPSNILRPKFWPWVKTLTVRSPVTFRDTPRYRFLTKFYSSGPGEPGVLLG